MCLSSQWNSAASQRSIIGKSFDKKICFPASDDALWRRSATFGRQGDEFGSAVRLDNLVKRKKDGT